MASETEGARKGIARAAIVLMFAALGALLVIASLPGGASNETTLTNGSAPLAQVGDASHG